MSADSLAGWLTHALELIPVILFSLTLHECAHGWVALKLGDPTARDLGRLTLNPLKHLDPLGTLAFFIIQFGWAKPVPVDWRYFKHPLRDMMWVAIAGPASNVALALGFSALLHWKGLVMALHGVEALQPLIGMLYLGVVINVILAVFNLIPIAPLDGSRVVTGLLPRRLAIKYAQLEPYGMPILLILMFLGVFAKVIHPVQVWAQAVLIPAWL